MGSVCLSSATILRCTSLGPLQNVALVIPTVVEVICTSSLIFKHRDIGRKHLLLTAEGWIYFLLSVLQMISTVAPAVRDNVDVFRAFDTGIGVASFLPLFFYTFFFFLFTSNELLETLPHRLINIAKYSLILFIPGIVIFNEIASFTGIVIRDEPLPDEPAGSPSVIQFLFLDAKSELLWAFFTSLTLALITAFQAAVFSFSFFRVVRAILDQRCIENKGSDKAHLFKGIVWICAGIKIGALESLVGLFGGGFAISLTRRIMRMMSRACISVGIAKGVDIMEDFSVIQSELRSSNKNNREQRQSRLREFISNPRISTFRQLSPTATSFHASSRATQPSDVQIDEKSIGQRPHYATFSQRQSIVSIKGGLPGMESFAIVREEHLKRHVTVSQLREEAPQLRMRFSVLEVPPPVVLASDVVKSRPQSVFLNRPVISTYRKSTEDAAQRTEGGDFIPPQPHFHGESNDSEHRESYNSSLSSPYEIVDARKLTQTIAVGQLYRPKAVQTPSIAAREFTRRVSYQPASPPGENSRTKSMASAKTNSITAAVRDLADKFPGPPDVSRTRPVLDSKGDIIGRRPRALPDLRIVQEQSSWEADSRTSAQYPSGAGILPRIVRPSSELSPVDPALPMEDDLVFISGENSPLAFAQPSPMRMIGKTSAGKPDYRTSTTTGNVERPKKVAGPSDEEYQLSMTPVSAPVGIPLQQSLKLSVAATPVPVIRQYGSPTTPTTGLSIISRLRESVAPNQVDAFLALGNALDTGKSRQFRVDNAPPMPQPPASSRSNRFKSEEKLTRIAEWLDTSASIAGAPEQMDPEEPPTMEELTSRPPIMPSPRENSLRNLHDRGKSIDALIIPWVSSPELAAARAVTGRSNASYEATMRMAGPRIKTVGKAPSRSTPIPTRTAHARASLYLQPIIIPPRNGNMPQVEYSSPAEMDESEVIVINNGRF